MARMRAIDARQTARDKGGGGANRAIHRCCCCQIPATVRVALDVSKRGEPPGPGRTMLKGGDDGKGL